MATTTRWALPYPQLDGLIAADVPQWMHDLAFALDGVAMDDQGTLANRPVSTSGSPGKKGRYYYVTGDATAINNGILWRDHGTGWDCVGGKIQPRDATDVPVTLIRAAIDSGGGDVIPGGGYTVNHTGTGVYVIAFTPDPFNGTPVVVASSTVGSAIIVTVPAIASGSCTVKTFDAAGAAIDAAFMLIAVGP